MKFPIRATVKDHGKINGIKLINLSEYHCHKITVPHGVSILTLTTLNGNIQAQYELEIEAA